LREQRGKLRPEIVGVIASIGCDVDLPVIGTARFTETVRPADPAVSAAAAVASCTKWPAPPIER
jgi:hypothetical protein